MACDSSIFRPIDSFIKYFGDIKPYHTKILEIVEQYIFREEINVEIEETPTFDITLENPTLCKGVGFGIDFDNECGFDALECCDLFECMGGFGLIFDNSDLLLTMPVVAITAGTPATNGTDDTGSASSITVSGNHLYDTYLNIQSIPDVQTMIVAGNQSALFSSHNMFWVVPRNSYQIVSGDSTNIQIQGNHTAQLLAKINIEIQNAGANDGAYGVIAATYSPGSNLTTITLNRELPANISGGNFIVEASTKNNGVYQIDGFTVVGGNTHLQLSPDTPARLTDAQVNNTHGVIQLRTGMIPNRKIWIEDDTVVGNNGEWKIVQVSFDVPTNQTIIVVDGTLYNSTNPTTLLKLFGYETGAGFDGLNECSEPKAFNVNAAISEWLTITIEDLPIPGLTPTPTATVSPTISVTPTISLSPTPNETVTPTPTVSSSAIPPSPTPTVTASASLTPVPLTPTPTITATATPTPTPSPSPVIVLATFSPSNRSPNSVLSNGNLTARYQYNSGTDNKYNHVFGTIPLSTGKYYWEVTTDTGAFLGQIHGIGISTLTLPLDSATVYAGANTYSSSVWPPQNAVYFNNAIVFNATDNPTPTFMFAFDATTREFWIGDTTTGWYNGGNPATGTAPMVNSLVVGTYYPVISLNNTNNIVTVIANFGQNPFIGTVPSGFKSGVY